MGALLHLRTAKEEVVEKSVCIIDRLYNTYICECAPDNYNLFPISLVYKFKLKLIFV